MRFASTKAGNIARQQAQPERIQAQEDPVRALWRQRLRELQQSLQDELDYYGQQIENLLAQITELESSPRPEEVDQHILALRQELINKSGHREWWTPICASRVCTVSSRCSRSLASPP
ncbi:MAG: hypothetical protein WBW48_09490 [Anaerolineae bacterium]